MHDELEQRVRRIYAAIGATEEHDMSNLPGRVTETDTGIEVFQDFSGGLTPEQIANLAHSVIHNIANLKDNLRKWAQHAGKNKSSVDEAFNHSSELQIIWDLANIEKHGYPPRNGGTSGRAPRLVDVRRVFQLIAAPASSASMTLGADGRPVILSGSGRAVVTGEIVDAEGAKIGDLYDIANKAIQDWESLLETYGIQSLTKQRQ